MKKIVLRLILVATLLLVALQDARAEGQRAIANRWGERYARTMPWHGQYYYAPGALRCP